MSDIDKPQQRMKMLANQSLTESGERERLIQLLRTRLLECGWNDIVVNECKEKVRQIGVENITLDTLISEVTPRARQSVPDSVKRELLQRIKTSLSNQSSTNRN